MARDLSFRGIVKRSMPEGMQEWVLPLYLKVMGCIRKSYSNKRYLSKMAKWFTRATGENFDLEHPETFNQKIQWIKVYGPLETMGILSDKFLVRDWIASKGCEQYLVPLLGVWSNAEEIDFTMLPSKFVLKATHGCGWNIVVRDRKALDEGRARRTLNRWLSLDYSACALFEPHYRYCEPRIIAEEYLSNGDDLYDYKFWCFGGKVDSIMLLMDRNTGKGLHMAFFDTEWNRLDYTYSFPPIEGEVPRPKKLREMTRLAERLSKGFAFARVDLYQLDDGTVRFGEITFTPASGACDWHPGNANYILGQKVNLEMF